MNQQTLATEAEPAASDVLVLADIAFDDAATLLSRFGLALERIADAVAIPGSYWANPKPASSATPCTRAPTRPCIRCCTKQRT